MVELQHNSLEPPELSAYRAENPHAGPADFDSPAFLPVKRAVRASLNADQGGLCAYCESTLSAIHGQIDHIKPKGGKEAHPHLTFVYTNYAHSCIDKDHCGQKKKDGILPIEPGPACNSRFVLNTDGSLDPVYGLTRSERHGVVKTRDMLGLNCPSLVRERQSWVKTIEQVMRLASSHPQDFLADKPFRHILTRLMG